VLQLRQREEVSARERLLATNTELRSAVEHRDRELARLAAIPVPCGPIDHDRLLCERQAAELVASSIIAARATVAKALTEATIAQVAWSKAARAVEALERLDRTRRAEHLAEEQRLEAIEVDDIVTSAYGRRASLVGSVDR
jgi:hypothetical protein